MTEKKEKLSKIKGAVSPMTWDEDDNVTSIAIITDDDDEYYVEPAEMESELMDFLDEYVEVKGKLRSHKGRQYISVSSFEEVSYDDDDEASYDDDDIE